MSKAWVAEYGAYAIAPDGRIAPAGEDPPLAEQVVDFSAGEAKCANAFQPQTRLIRVNVDTTSSHLVGSGTFAATIANKRMPQDSTEYFPVKPGPANKISFIANS